MRAVLPEVDPQTGKPCLGELPDPTPAAGEALIEIKATALNQADLLQMRGHYPPPTGESAVPGLECAGVIRSLGEGVTDFSVGMRVMALLAGGGHADLVAAPAGQLMPIPEQLSFTEAAALPEAALTSWTNLVVEGGLESGQTVLITGAASGVGTMAVQMAHELGARVLAAGRNRVRLERLLPLGAHGLCLLGGDLPQEVRNLNQGSGVDVVFDLVGGPHLALHLAALERGGRLVLIGLMAGPQAELNLGLLMRSRLRVIGSVLRGRSRAEKEKLVAGFRRFGEERLRDGRLKPIIDRVVPLSAVARAYADLEAGGVLGKVVMEV